MVHVDMEGWWCGWLGTHICILYVLFSLWVNNLCFNGKREDRWDRNYRNTLHFSLNNCASYQYLILSYLEMHSAEKLLREQKNSTKTYLFAIVQDCDVKTVLPYSKFKVNHWFVMHVSSQNLFVSRFKLQMWFISPVHHIYPYWFHNEFVKDFDVSLTRFMKRFWFRPFADCLKRNDSIISFASIRIQSVVYLKKDHSRFTRRSSPLSLPRSSDALQDHIFSMYSVQHF